MSDVIEERGKYASGNQHFPGSSLRRLPEADWAECLACGEDLSGEPGYERTMTCSCVECHDSGAIADAVAERDKRSSERSEDGPDSLKRLF